MSACGAGIDVGIKLLHIGGLQIASYVIFIEKEKLASLSPSLFVRDYPRRRNVYE